MTIAQSSRLAQRRAYLVSSTSAAF